jgi:hypothetical protein
MVLNVHYIWVENTPPASYLGAPKMEMKYPDEVFFFVDFLRPSMHARTVPHIR